MAEPIKLVTTKSDAELAQEFKERLVEAYKPVMVLCDEIDAAGFEPNIQTGKGPLGKQVITTLRVVKVF